MRIPNEANQNLHKEITKSVLFILLLIVLCLTLLIRMVNHSQINNSSPADYPNFMYLDESGYVPSYYFSHGLTNKPILYNAETQRYIKFEITQITLLYPFDSESPTRFETNIEFR